MSSREMTKLAMHKYSLLVMFNVDECAQKNFPQSADVEAKLEVSPVRQK